MNVADAIRGVAYLLLMYAGFPLVIGRIASYMSGHAPPISLWGRIRTGRLIIPAYDVVFFAPLLTIFTAIVGVFFVESRLIPYEYSLPATCGLVLLVSLTVGPSRRKWQLTAPCRIAPQWGLQQNKREYIEI